MDQANQARSEAAKGNQNASKTVPPQLEAGLFDRDHKAEESRRTSTAIAVDLG